MYPTNAWYVIATSSELNDPERPLLARRVLDRPIVLYRAAAGGVVALEDRCPHRFAPLSMGMLVEGGIQCGYHGLEYNAAGECYRVPGRPGYTPPGARVRSYPAVERWRFVWIWPGEPAQADPNLIPELWRNDHPDWAVIEGAPIPFTCDYRMIIDNLLDPSHVSFVHRTTLGTSDMAEIPVETTTTDTQVAVTRWLLDRPPAPLFKSVGGFAGNVDRWITNRFTAPALIETDMGSCEAGTGAREGNTSRGVQLYAYNFLTPETASTSHYFWTHTRNFKQDDAALTESLLQQLLVAVNEDLVIIDAAQRRMDEFADVDPVNIPVDAGPLAARRILERLALEDADARELVPVRS
jgi:vanillate O-demethylase monooxygenase subunit